MDYKESKNKGQEYIPHHGNRTLFNRVESLHPYQLLMYLFLVSSAIIFLFLLIAHFATRPADISSENFQLPKTFIFSTILMLVSSLLLKDVQRQFRDEEMRQLRNTLGLALLMGMMFSVFQYIGWLAMMNKGIAFEGRTGGVYMYILSGLHFVHLIGGLIFLLKTFLEILKTSKDPILCLVATTNPYNKLKLNLMVTYWYYLDITWLVVFLYFLFSY